VRDAYSPVIGVKSPTSRFPGSCNCACDAAPVAVLLLGTSSCAQSTRLCGAHAAELLGKLTEFLRDRVEGFAFKRRGPRIGGGE